MELLIQQVLQWWLVIFFLGALAIPFTTKLLDRFFDKGYAFSKIIGLLLLSYVSLLLGTLHFLPFTTISLFGLMGLFLIISFFFAKKFQTIFIMKNNWKIFLFEEILFFACLFFWSFVKSFQPDIHGLEKFMDYGFVNSILRTSYFPPKDMWMTPLSINYYYFGHLMTAVLTQLSFLKSNVTFNLMLASLFAFTFTESFSLGANFIYYIRQQKNTVLQRYSLIAFGLFTALLVTFSGNLHAAYTFFTPYQNDTPVPPTQLIFSPQTFPNQYWYPNATRFIYHTIHEFPIYSFVVSDLHGHVLDIPLVLLTIGVLLLFFFEDAKTRKNIFLKTGLLGCLAGIMYMTNAWDGLIYGGVTALLLFQKTFSRNIFTTIFSKKFFLSLALLLICFVTISLPFSVFFKPFASQIGLNCSPAFLQSIGNIGPLIFENGYCDRSPLWQLAILYGFFFFWFVSLISLMYVELKKKGEVRLSDLFIFMLGSLGFILIIVPEFVYLKDIYTTYFRANTMFKLVYQSFILLSLTSGYTIFRILSELQSFRENIFKKLYGFVFLLLSFSLITIVFIYPFFATSSYFNNFKNFQGLDGTTYLQRINTDDYSAILWLNSHIKDQPVILEAQGDSYTDYERISSNTGLPTVFGWMVHEWLWRGTYEIVPGRIADVKALYESTNIAETKKLLQKYSVQYVYIGDLERQKYTKINEAKFTILGTATYSSGGVTIYKISQ